MQSAQPLTPEDIARAFTGKIKRPRVSIFYTIGLFAVTLVMALLPLIYLGLIGAVVYGTYYHATHNFGPIMGGPGRGRVVVLKFVAYATPIFMGTILSFFMVKPLLARRMDKHQPYALNPEAEPTLYEFIRKICEQVGAPMPTLIELDSGTNAAASLRRGFGSFFSNDLGLHIGLSLMAGLSAREFAGVIAHEFGHFTQGVAMRLNYIVNRIDGWFARLIYERDSWDAWLEELGETQEASLAIMVGFARLGVWFSRQVLTLLMMFGHAISCFLSRQMEFHADQFEIQLAGSPAFESTSARLREINALTAVAFKEVRVTWNLNKRLPDNLPQYVLNKAAGETGSKVQQALKKDLGFVKTGLFHTHPSDADRVREARLSNAPGIFNLDRPASDLFQNFAVPARIVTRLFYEEIELPLPMAKIYEVEPPAAPKGAGEAAAPEFGQAAIDRFLFGVVSPLRPIYPQVKALSDSESTSALANIQALPQQINQIAEQVAGACGAFEEADQKMLAAAREGGDVKVAREEREQARRSLRAVLQACEERLGLALSLGRVPRAKCEQLRSFAPALDELDGLRIAIARGSVDQEGPALHALKESVANVEAALRDVACPWPEGQGLNLYDFARATQGGDALFTEWGQTLVNITAAGYMRVLGELTLAAEQAIENPQPRRAMQVSAPAATVSAA